jgi:hypothetical protein
MIRPAVIACLSACLLATGGAATAAEPGDGTAQLLGTVNDTRGRWNPFLSENDMTADASGGFYRDVALSATGGRNGDGVYALRFSTGRRLDGVFKIDPAAPNGRLLSGEEAVRRGGNLLVRVPADGIYRIRFDPRDGSHGITPPVEVLGRITSMQVNGFVHDHEGDHETVVGGLVRPAAKWDETLPGHQMVRRDDGSWEKVLRLSATGGHQKNGVYQFLFSADRNDDRGFCAVNGEPGRLRAGCGYASRLGRIDESAVVIRVAADGDYTLRVWPDELRYTVDPPVESLNALPDFQINGSVVAKPWALDDPDHRMTRRADGVWEKTVHLTPSGGDAGNGIHVMNFSIGAQWALDGIATGGRWGHTWHSLPQESNILFRVERAGDYTVTLDPAAGRFAVDPPVVPLPTITSLKILGSFSALADDGKQGWNHQDARHAMASADGHLFVRDLPLKAGESVAYKYAADDAGWSLGFTDYPYDGEARLSSHGDPPPLSFTAGEAGIHRFHADVVTGRHGVDFVGKTSQESGK